MYATCICQWFISVCSTAFRVLRSASVSMNYYMFLCVHLLACAFQCVLSTGSVSMYWKLFLEWPSKSHGVQLCCLCASACVIQFEWRKPWDTSAALSRLRSSTVCRWFFDGANLEALWLRGSDPAKQTVNETNTQTPMHAVYIYKHTHAKHSHSLTSQRIPLIAWQSATLFYL